MLGRVRQNSEINIKCLNLYIYLTVIYAIVNI